MLLELWIASTSATGLYWTFGRRLKKQLETPHEVQEIHAENAVELSAPERSYQPPIYIGSGSPVLIGIPIGGGFSDSE